MKAEINGMFTGGLRQMNQYRTSKDSSCACGCVLSKINSQRTLTEADMDIIEAHPYDFSCDGCGELINPLQQLGNVKVCDDCYNFALLSMQPYLEYQ